MNARGIPTAAYQVLHMLSYPGGRGGGGRYLGWEGVGTLRYPSPLLCRPGQGGRYLGLGVLPFLTWPEGRYLGVPPPHPDLAWEIGTLGYPIPSLHPDLARGIGTLARREGRYLGVPPPPGVNRLKTLPSPILRMRSVTNDYVLDIVCSKCDVFRFQSPKNRLEAHSSGNLFKLEPILSCGGLTVPYQSIVSLKMK